MTDREKDETPFLSRWSERKRAVRAEAEGEGEAHEAQEEAHAESEEELEANRRAAEAIDLETLTDKSDYAPFFRPGVPAALKQAALRKLWRSNPVFAVLDGLNDYDEDFAWPTSGGEMVRSAWKVGRGFLSGEDEAEAEERAAAKPVEDPLAERQQPRPIEAQASPSGESEPEAAEDSGAEPQEAEPVKVSLSSRLDFAAFAKEKGKG
jgi:hypothetical protein